jgi:outer membrane protein OmpA-like peptidoglycan-associated protein
MVPSEDEAPPLAKVELAFKTGSGKESEQWAVREFWMKERLGAPYHGFVDIVASRREVDFSALVAKSCVLEIRRGPDRVRRFHGLIFKIEHLGAHAGSALARVGMAAAVHALSYGQNSRFFENATAAEIVEMVLKEGLEPFGRKVRLNLVRKYAKREYTTQTQEDDLSFVHRLMVDEGMTFHFAQDLESETVVVVDSNYSLPRIKTMPEWKPPEKAGPAGLAALSSSLARAAAQKKTTFSAKVVDDATGEPIAGVKLELRLVDGSTLKVASGSDGSVEVLDVEPGSHTLSGSIGGTTKPSALEFVSVGESSSAGTTSEDAPKAPGKATKRPAADQSASPPSFSLVAVERYKVKKGDALEKIAAKNDLDRAMLAYFNWGVYSPREVEEKLRDQVGCTEKDENGRYVLADEDEPGIIFIPKPWRAAGLEAGKQHTVRVKPIQRPEPKRLESKFALGFLTGLGKKLSAQEFAGWCAGIFGFDLEPRHYRSLQQDLLNGAFTEPTIEVSNKTPSGHIAWYDNARGAIGIHEDLPEKALSNNEDAWKLLLILVEEFGHHVDNQLRKHYSNVGGDAEMDEGARTAYSLLNFDWDTKSKIAFAEYWRGGRKQTLEVEYAGLHEAVERWVGKDRASEKDGTLEFFSAGTGRGPGSHAHESIEDVLQGLGPDCSPAGLEHLLPSGFHEEERKRIYFGNWLRDFSQLADPKIVKSEKKKERERQSDTLMRFRRETLTKVVALLAREKFGETRDASGRLIFEVTPERLGVYRPEEHIDNPFGTDAEGQMLDSAFRGPCLVEAAPELQVDEKTWLKNYIASPGPWTTSLDYVKRQLALAMLAGRTAEGMRHFGAALHTLEDFFAHSNFVELMLRELRREVVPWSRPRFIPGDKNKKRYYPLVTGVFASLDTLSSVAIEATKMLEKLPVCVAGKRSEGTEIALLLLEDYDLDAHKGTEEVLKAIEELEKDYPNAATLVCRNVTLPVKHVTTKLGYLLHEAANTVDDYQTQYANGPNPENPTHTQLAKDHDDHPLHELAALCAQELVQTVGRAMADAWNQKLSLRELQELAGSYFVHPHLITTGVARTVLEHVHFETGSPALTPGFLRPDGPLEKARELLLTSEETSVEIEGHTDNQGPAEYNMALSRARAQAVSTYLANAGISASRLKAGAFGFSRPLAPNTTAENRARNRRVELTVLGSAETGVEHVHRIRKLIADWAARPDSQEKIEQASSPTFVEYQMKKHRQAAEAQSGAEKAPKTAAESTKEEHEKVSENPVVKRFFEYLKKLGEEWEGQ